MKNINTSSFSIFAYFIKTFPIRCTMAMGLLILAGFIETVGISALLPLLNTFLENEKQSDPNFLTQITDSVFDFFQIEQSFRNLLLVVVTAICLKAILIYQTLKMVSFAATDITKDLRIRLIKSLMDAKWQYFNALPIGQSATSIANEAENASIFFMMMGKSLAALTQALIYIYIAMLVDWKISLFAIIFGGCSAFLMKSLVLKAKTTGTAMADYLTKLIINLTEALSGAKSLKAMGQEKHFIHLIEDNITKVNDAKKKQLVSNLMLQAFHEPVLVILIAAGLFWTHTYSNYPVAELFLIAFLFHRLISQINMFQNTYQKTLNYEGSVRSILTALDTAQENVEVIDGQKPFNFQNKISINDISISYGAKNIFKDFSANIPAHKITLIFGPSGVGKTTLLDVLLGFIKPNKGNIKIDNGDQKDINMLEWRQSIGYMPQDTFLFHSTILENITLGDNDIPKEDVIDALKKTNGWEFVKELENDLNFNVGEKGGRLSGGQRQRIAMARAIVRKPEILILDESTTGLDKESEGLIIKALQSMSKHTTVIIISHDPDMMNIADHVIKLQK